MPAGIEPVTTDDTERYLAGFGTHAQQTLDGVNDPIRYLHGDLIRSTMLTSNEAGQAAERMAYTAFGEPVTLSGVGGDLPTGFPRYGYAGGWGCQTGRDETGTPTILNDPPVSDLISLAGVNPDLPVITLQHVGHRWYDPSIGRFLQRDPIGIRGGINVYEYAGSCPTEYVDPSGLWPRGVMEGMITEGAYKPNSLVNESMSRGYVDGLTPLANPLGPPPTHTTSQIYASYCVGSTLGELTGLVYGAGLLKGATKLAGKAAGWVNDFVKGIDRGLRPPNPGPYVSPLPGIPRAPLPK